MLKTIKGNKMFGKSGNGADVDIASAKYNVGFESLKKHVLAKPSQISKY